MSIKFDGMDGDNTVYGLYKDGEKVGYIKAQLELCTIMNIWVREDLRCRNLGTKLVRHIEALALQKGCKKVRVKDVEEEDRGFYEKCGYKLEGPDEYGDFFGGREL